MPAPVTQRTPETVPPRRLSASDLALLDVTLARGDRAIPTDWGAGALMAPLERSQTVRRFRFRAQPQAVGAARRVLHEWEAHFDPVLFYDLSLCVSELVTHSVQHGDHDTTDYLELAVRRRAGGVRAEISEPRLDVELTAAPSMTASDWGMFIVDRVADRWGVDHDAGTLVWCEIDLAADGRSRATHGSPLPPR